MAAQHGDVERAVIAHAWSAESRRAYKGDNIKVRLHFDTHTGYARFTPSIQEGLRAFSEVRTFSLAGLGH